LRLAAETVHAETSLAALAAGDDAALRAAYREHHAYVRAFTRRLVGDDDEAEDLVHEVFSRLPRAARRFRGESSLRTLLVGMAINHAGHRAPAAGAAGRRGPGPAPIRRG
jgi:RNA polymerase sigma-70 factor (ECF subfamily)